MPYSVVYEKSFMLFFSRNKKKVFRINKNLKHILLDERKYKGKGKYDVGNGALGILYEMEISCFPHFFFYFKLCQFPLTFILPINMIFLCEINDKEFVCSVTVWDLNDEKFI